MDRAQVDVVDLEVPEVAFDMGEGLVGIDDTGCVEVGLFDRGAQHIDPVEGGFVGDGVLVYATPTACSRQWTPRSAWPS